MQVLDKFLGVVNCWVQVFVWGFPAAIEITTSE